MKLQVTVSLWQSGAKHHFSIQTSKNVGLGQHPLSVAEYGLAATKVHNPTPKETKSYLAHKSYS